MNMMRKIEACTGSHDEWDAAVMVWKSARDTWWKFATEVRDPIIEEMDRRAPRPSLTYCQTTRSGQKAYFSFIPSELDEMAESFVHGRFVKPMRDAWRAYEVALEKAKANLNYDQMDALDDQLWGNLTEAEDALVALTPPDAEALALKIQIIFDDGRRNQDWIAKLVADARAIAPRCFESDE